MQRLNLAFPLRKAGLLTAGHLPENLSNEPLQIQLGSLIEVLNITSYVHRNAQEVIKITCCTVEKKSMKFEASYYKRSDICIKTEKLNRTLPINKQLKVYMKKGKQSFPALFSDLVNTVPSQQKLKGITIGM